MLPGLTKPLMETFQTRVWFLLPLCLSAFQPWDGLLRLFSTGCKSFSEPGIFTSEDAHQLYPSHLFIFSDN